MQFARLTRYGLLSVTGEDARQFLHAQLTNDIEHLPAGRAALAGWCSAKGRLLASFLVVPAGQGFLLQLSKDLVPSVQKRLSMFILRSRVKIEDASGRFFQFGVWANATEIAELPGLMEVALKDEEVRIRVTPERCLVLSPDPRAFDEHADPVDEERWSHAEIEAGRPFITAATQDLFVPQMVNYEKLGGVDFQKGCYPGQEVVARAQYRGQVKRRLTRLPAPAGARLQPGQEFNGGVVVDSAGGEVLAVLPVTE
jgi:tRNA-modifying protein YgfZ